jgi:hypothetical protein
MVVVVIIAEHAPHEYGLQPIAGVGCVVSTLSMRVDAMRC